MHAMNAPVNSVPNAIPTTRLLATPTGEGVYGGHMDGVGVGNWEQEEAVSVTVTVVVTTGVEVRADSLGEGSLDEMVMNGVDTSSPWQLVVLGVSTYGVTSTPCISMVKGARPSTVFSMIAV